MLLKVASFENGSPMWSVQPIGNSGTPEGAFSVLFLGIRRLRLNPYQARAALFRGTELFLPIDGEYARVLFTEVLGQL